MTTSRRQPALDDAERGRLIIVCGLPASGKTTRARLLAADRGGVRLAPDEWLAALGTNVWDGEMRERVETLQWSLAKELLRVGATVIIEWGTWGRSERDKLRGEARSLGAAVELCFLHAPLDVLWGRIQARRAEGPSIERSHLDEWSRNFERPDAEELRLFDPPNGSRARSS